MAEKTCKMCGEVWDTREFGECPTCREIREVDSRAARAVEPKFGELVADDYELTDPVGAVLRQADEVDSRASSMENLVNLIAVLGIIGGVILGVSGFASGEGVNGFLMAAGIGVVLFWLLVRAVGAAFATRLNLAAAVARMQADQSDT